MIDTLHDARFLDKSPAQIYATLLDDGKYLCSIRTMYRILHSLKEVRERRNVLRHPNCTGLRSSEPRIEIIGDFWCKLIETIRGGWCTLIETGRTLIETDANYLRLERFN